jgi:membrane protein YqaA with SNARE-associated domain
MPASAPSGPSPDRVSRRDRVVRIGLRLAVVAAVLALAVWANLYAADHDLVREATRRYGYVGILAAAAVSGFNLVVPVPIIAFFPFFMEVGLAPVPTVLVIAAGMTAGDLVGYLVGRTARDVVRPTEGGVVRRLEALRDRHPRLPLLVMFLYAAFAPAPNEIVVIPLAFLRYPVAGIFAAVLAGNLIFNALVAAGVIHIFGLL